MASEPHRRLSIPEYLVLERRSEERHEYLDGEMFAMSGASRRHNRIVLNIGKGLDSALEDRGCEVFVSEMRVLTPDNKFFTYPDVVAVCGEPQFADAEVDTLLNPDVIIEVLSPSTEDYDRGPKFAHYRSIPSLREYVMVAQDRVQVEHYLRQPNDDWLPLADLDDLGQTLELRSVGCSLSLAAIYRRVFKPMPASGAGRLLAAMPR
ncbi:MAG: Uma2 family endonuclease [Thermoanaerobaculia bacterium]